MFTPILTTKLFVPPPRPKRVLRPRLIAQMDKTWQCKLTLVSAPAGYGKTTLVSEWIAGSQHPAVWLSLDEGDADFTRFLTHFIAALQTIYPDAGVGLLRDMQSNMQSAPLPSDVIFATLLNEMAAVQDDFILVLDDYHSISSTLVNSTPNTLIDNGIAFLLDHLLPTMHLIIITREDPQLPLSRLRVRNQLTEVRAADLRFTHAEAVQFFNQVMGLKLTVENVAVLEKRTEGWIAGLQLAALSMEGRADTSGFIQAFTGSHRFVVDYLVEEVLQRQSIPVRDFLLQTSLLDRMCGSLCDSVTDYQNSDELLETLERGNMLIVPLDEQRVWYRYHHLFADVLRTRVTREFPDRIPDLHRRACVWYEQHNLLSEAVHHALAAKDFERAASLVERAWPAMRSTRQEATAFIWMNAFPDHIFHSRPVLNVAYAWALLDAGAWEGAETRLRNVEQQLADVNNAPNDNSSEIPHHMIVVDEQQYHSLSASIANARAYRAQALGDVSGAVRYTRLALDLLPDDAFYERGTTAALLGLAYWASGNLDAAASSFADGLASLRMGGGLLILIGGTFILVEIKKAQGQLREATHLLEQALQLAETQAKEQNDVVLQGTPELYLGLSFLSLERNDLATAKQLLAQGQSFGKQASLPGYDHLWCIAQAQIYEAEGNWDGAFDEIQKAAQLYYRSPIPDTRPIAALRVRMCVSAGRLNEALAWVHQQKLSLDDELSYFREYEHLTFARVLIAQTQREGNRQEEPEHTLGEVADFLTRLLQAAEENERTGTIIELLILQAIVEDRRGDSEAAFAALDRALELAEPEGYVRIFVNEGPILFSLLTDYLKQSLTHATKRSGLINYVRRLLEAFGSTSDHVLGNDTDKIPAADQLLDSLSERELEVLRLLATDLSGPDIALKLMVSLNTVRTHIKNIYSKLGVNSRRAAVRYAETLGLL